MPGIKSNPKFQAVLRLGIQGRVKEALPLVKKIKIAGLSASEAKFVAQFKKRFDRRQPKRHFCQDPFVKKLISAYQEYWFECLLGEVSQSAAERRLYKSVRELAAEFGEVFKPSFDGEYFSERVKTLVEKRGFYCITGIVEPLQELEIWQKESRRVFTVDLPDSKQKVSTVFMKDFIIKGWMDLATMGVFSPGGWAKRNALYCNSSFYNTSSEKFRVSYLAHEAQHYSDFRCFPNLEQADLEYRAKLAELYSARRIARKTLKNFTRMAEKNKASPHAYSNYCLVRDIAKRVLGKDFPANLNDWDNVKTDEINAAAAALIVQHSNRLRKIGAKSVKRIIK